MSDPTGVSPTDAALIGALGAVLGGALVSAGNFLIERSRRKQEDSKQAARDKREIRQGGRLVLEELSEIEGAIRNAVRRGRLSWGEGGRQLPASAWHEHRTTLAVHLDDEPWRLVGAAYREADDLERRPTDIERDTELLRPAFRSVRAAMESLERATGPQAGIFAYTGYASTEEMESELWPRATPTQ